MFSYANCTTLTEFQTALRGQIELWKGDCKPEHECYQLVFDYIRAVNSRLYAPGMDQDGRGFQGVMARLEELYYTRSTYTSPQAYEEVHNIIFPVSRDFTPGQLQVVVPLVYNILERYTESRVVQIPVDQQVAALIDNILGGAGMSGAQLEAMHPLTAYTNDDGFFGTGLDMDARKKDKELRRALHESSLDSYEHEQMMWAMQDVDMDDEQAQIEEAIRRSMQDQ